MINWKEVGAAVGCSERNATVSASVQYLFFSEYQ